MFNYKMKKPLKLFNYSGNKSKYMGFINEKIMLVQDSKTKTYCEPFVGSGSVFFNLINQADSFNDFDDFDEYILNDLCRNVYNMLNTFKYIDYEFYKKTIDSVFDKFGDMKCTTDETNTDKGETCKSNYYSFRNWFNENHYLKDSYEEGIYCSMLGSMCINSFLRFSKTGMNQSWGNRCFEVNIDSFYKIQEKLKKATISNIDGVELIAQLKRTRPVGSVLYFLDPPYYTQASSYESFDLDDFERFLSVIEHEPFVYTDILNEQNQSIKNKEKMRTMKNTSPLAKRRDSKNEEYIFWSGNTQI